MKLFVAFLAALGVARAAAPLAEPALSPDTKEIAFVSGGDIWIGPAAGGPAHLLVSHPATESRPLFAPDGRSLAFVSTRTGNGDIYVLSLATGALRRLTFDDANDQLDAWSPDSQWIYYSSSARDISGMNDIYRVPAAGGTPMPFSADRYASEYFAAPAPDNSTIAFAARGIAGAQWWRRGHSHIDESEIWVRREGTPAKYEQVSASGAKHLWPMWTPDGRTLYYVRDLKGVQNLCRHTLGAAVKPVTQFTSGRVLWPNISVDGRFIVFERNFHIWKFDTAANKAAEVAFTLRGAPASAAVTHARLTSDFRGLELSPDGKKVAFVARAEVFAAGAKDGGDAVRLTRTPAAESDLAWAPDSNRLAYVSERDGTAHLYLYDFTSRSETQLTSAVQPDNLPVFSPNGKFLAFQRGAREIRIIDLAAKQEKLLAEARLERPPFGPDAPLAWSPDGAWLAYVGRDERGFMNVAIAPAAGGRPVPASFLPNTFSNGVRWLSDGASLLLQTGQRTEPGRIARIDVIPRRPFLREQQFRDLFKPTGETQPKSNDTAKPAKPETKKVEIVAEGIRQRVSLLPLGVDVNTHAVSADGKTLLLLADSAGQVNLYTYSLDEAAKTPPVARQLTSTAGRKSSPCFTPDGKDVFFLEGGRIQSVNIETRQVKPLAVTAELDVDFDSEKTQVFSQAWQLLRDNFYDAAYHGADWNGVRERYAPFVEGARTPDEMRRVINLMVGELNASHLGIGAPPSQLQTTTGRLGLRFDRAAYDSERRLRITEVISLGPAARTRSIHPGDELIAVNGVPIDKTTNLDERLEHTIGREVSLTVAAADGSNRREVALKPVNLAEEKTLLYRQWVEIRREYVARVSNGQLGYVHIPDMGAASLERFHLDLDSENRSRRGVIIDVRNNNGGFVNVYAIDVLARRGYLGMTSRGGTLIGARTSLGQRSLELPTILVVNQHSLSDAEDFTEGYRSLKLGKVVGEPTAGWIIYTWGEALLDGSSFRIPRVRITDANGADMELHPRPVDVAVARPVGESYTEKDSQLDAAVRELLAQIGAAK